MTIVFNDTSPAPPDHLIDRVVSYQADEDRAVILDGFMSTGQQSVRDIEAALATVNKSLLDFESVLEFGSGCGRIMRWLGPVGEQSKLYGCDIDEEAMDWSNENLGFASFSANPAEPPLPYDDQSFDLVFNHSVFTHIDERMQDLWLAELYRVTKPGGLVLATVHGEIVLEQIENGAAVTGESTYGWREQLESRGIVFIADDSYVGSWFPDFYHTTIHAPWYVFEHWGRSGCSVRGYLPRRALGFQDYVILERPLESNKPVPENPIRPNAGGSGAAPTSVGDDSEAGRLDRIEAALRMPPLVRNVLNLQADRINRIESELRSELDSLRDELRKR